MGSNEKPLVAVIMGSKSDWGPCMKAASEMLTELKIPHENCIVSAHRTPERARLYAKTAQARGLRIIIAGAGGAAHLAGVVASYTVLPVLGVPVESSSLKGLDSLLSTVQMPGGVPVATFSIGRAGAKNAALFAAEILAQWDDLLLERLEAWRKKQTDDVPVDPTEPSETESKPNV